MILERDYWKEIGNSSLINLKIITARNIHTIHGFRVLSSIVKHCTDVKPEKQDDIRKIILGQQRKKIQKRKPFIFQLKFDPEDA